MSSIAFRATSNALRGASRSVQLLGSRKTISSAALTRVARLPADARTLPGSTRWLSDESKTKIDGAVKANPVVLFMKGTADAPQCGFSRTVVQILDIQGVPREKLQTYNVLEDPQLRTDIKEYSQWPTVPQLYVNGEFVGGCDILLGMHQSGELEELLEKNSILPPLDTPPSSAKAS